MSPRSTYAFGVFGRNLDRSRAFLRIFDGPTGRGPGQPSNDEKELLRGAVVFAVGALDAYLHELILEIVPKFGGDQESLRDALKAIAKDDPSLSLRVSLAPDGATKSEEFVPRSTSGCRQSPSKVRRPSCVPCRTWDAHSRGRS